MSEVTGTVEKIFSKTLGNGQDVYNINVNKEWYGYGFEAPTFSEGDTIRFNWSANGKFKNVDTKSVAKVQADNKESGSDQRPASAGRSYGNNQIAIQQQSARNAAIEVVKWMFENNFVTTPTKKDDKYDAFLTLVDEVTSRFYQDTDAVVTAGGMYPEEMEQAVAHDDFE